MGLKPKSTITSQKSRANQSLVLVELQLTFTSNNSFQLFLYVLNFTLVQIELSFEIEVVCAPASLFFQ